MEFPSSGYSFQRDVTESIRDRFPISALIRTQSKKNCNTIRKKLNKLKIGNLLCAHQRPEVTGQIPSCNLEGQMNPESQP